MRRIILVPTLRVGMFFGRSAALTLKDAERPKMHSHAERGNEESWRVEA